MTSRVGIRGLVCLALLVTSGSARGGPPLVPTPIGVGALFHPTAANPAVLRAAPVGVLGCGPDDEARTAVHLELFARGRVVIVPAGIGLAAPVRKQDRYLASTRCSYPVRTREVTGLVELTRGRRLTLGDFFAVWGRRLGPRAFLGFELRPGERVRTYVNGSTRLGDPLAIPLRPHDEIVLELGPNIPPHESYRFPKGL